MRVEHPVVVADNLERVFPSPGSPVAALVDASFVAYSGEQIAVTGPSGSGKSTLLNLIALLDSPTSGRLEILGLTVDDLPEASRCSIRANYIGLVFQAFNLLSGRSAVENVALGSLYRGLPKVVRLDMALAAIDRVGLSHRAKADVSTLSGGEKQRVAVARAIANRPKLLLADEPTGNLDSKNTGHILDLLRELSDEGYCQLIVTHDDAVADKISRRIRVDDGVTYS